MSDIASKSLAGIREGVSLLKVVVRYFFNAKIEPQNFKEPKNKVTNTATQKNHNNLPVIEPKDIEICGLQNKTKQKMQMVVLRKHNDLQENTGKQFNEIIKMIHDQKKKLNKKTEII